MDSFHTTAKGDRVTLTGNKRTGKSSVALDIMVNQGRRGMRCVYVAMGHSEARITHIRKYLDDAGVLDMSTIVAANIYDPFALQVRWKGMMEGLHTQCWGMGWCWYRYLHKTYRSNINLFYVFP